jgi:hypothetical protein
LHVRERDRGLYDVRPAPVEGESPIERDAPTRDLFVIPPRAVLVVEQHQVAVARTLVASRIVQQHQGEQSVHFGAFRKQLRESTTEPQRFGRELVATAIPLVEDQVHDRERGANAG